jgi:hypothetical protein
MRTSRRPALMLIAVADLAGALAAPAAAAGRLAAAASSRPLSVVLRCTA